MVTNEEWAKAWCGCSWCAEKHLPLQGEVCAKEPLLAGIARGLEAALAAVPAMHDHAAEAVRALIEKEMAK